MDPLGLFGWKSFFNAVSAVAAGAAVVATGVAVGLAAVAAAPTVAAIAGTVAIAAGAISFVSSVAGTIVECTDGGGLDSPCITSMALSVINGVSFTLGRFATVVVDNVLLDLVGLGASTAGYITQLLLGQGGPK